MQEWGEVVQCRQREMMGCVSVCRYGEEKEAQGVKIWGREGVGQSVQECGIDSVGGGSARVFRKGKWGVSEEEWTRVSKNGQRTCWKRVRKVYPGMGNVQYWKGLSPGVPEWGIERVGLEEGGTGVQ